MSYDQQTLVKYEMFFLSNKYMKRQLWPKFSRVGLFWNLKWALERFFTIQTCHFDYFVLSGVKTLHNGNPRIIKKLFFN